MDARTVALVSAGDPGRRSRGIRITFPAGEDSGVGEIAFGAQGKHRLPLVGAAAPFPVDEKMANSGGGFSWACILNSPFFHPQEKEQQPPQVVADVYPALQMQSHQLPNLLRPEK